MGVYKITLGASNKNRIDIVKTMFDNEAGSRPFKNMDDLKKTKEQLIEELNALRNQARTAREESETKYRSLIENINDTVFSLDMNGRITYISPAVEKATGYRPEELIGQSFQKFIHPDDLGLVMEDFKKTLNGRIAPLEFRILNKEGFEIWIKTSSRPILEDGKPAGLTGMIEDITESKKTKMELERAYEELQTAQSQILRSEKMAALGRLAGGVAHGFNNPLTVILGFTQYLARILKDDARILKPLQSIEQETVRCQKLVQELLTFSRSERVHKEDCDTNDIVETILTLVQTKARTESIEVVREVEKDLPRISANAGQIEQMLVNLCGNAIEAMNRGGTLTFKARRAAEHGKEAVEIRIQDTGAGIPEEIQSRIFDPFFTTKRVGEGTGLGLSIAYEIVKNHSGTIEVQSHPGFTEFCVRLPAKKNPAN